jgi:8-amino-7-oxononanoate synthase
MAIIPTLLRRGDLLFADRLVHASIIDAARLSQARLIRFLHNDPVSLEKRLQQFSASGKRLLVVTESLFSMDGDLAPLEELAKLTSQYNAMFMVDEAHSTGTFGKAGVGLVRSLQLQKETTLSMGTLSKALGGYGGFVACSQKLRNLLVQSARAFIYTTAPPPSVAGAAIGAFELLQENPNLGHILQDRAETFRSLLKKRGLDTLQSQSQIIPILIGSNQRTLEISKKLRKRGIIAPAIRPPTVPKDTARLRLCVTLAHTSADLQYAADQIAEVVRREK